MNYELDNGLKMSYDFHSNPSSDTCLVFVNGLSQSKIVWTPFIYTFKSRYSILVLDLIFQGDSDKSGPHKTFEQHASDVMSLVKSLNIQKIIPIGISYGGAVVQRILVHYPEKVSKGILISTFAHKTPYFNIIGHSWKRALETGGYALMLDVMLPTVLGQPYFENPIIPIEQMKEMRTGLNDNKEALLKLMIATELAPDYRQILKEVTVPVLIIHGSLDPLTTPAMGLALQEAIPNSHLEVIPQKGHSLNIEAVPELLTLCDSFLGR